MTKEQEKEWQSAKEYQDVFEIASFIAMKLLNTNAITALARHGGRPCKAISLKTNIKSTFDVFLRINIIISILLRSIFLPEKIHSKRTFPDTRKGITPNLFMWFISLVAHATFVLK